MMILGDCALALYKVGGQIYDRLPRPVKQIAWGATVWLEAPIVTAAKYANDAIRKTMPPQMCSQLEISRCFDETTWALVKVSKPNPLPFKREDLLDNLVEEHDARLVYNVSHTGAEVIYDLPLGKLAYGAVKISGVAIPIPITLAPTLVHDTLNLLVIPYCKEGGKADQYNQAFRALIVCFNNFFLERERESVIRHFEKPSKRKRVTPLQMLGEIQYNWTGYERETHWNPFVEIFRTTRDWYGKMVEINGLEDRVATKE